MELLICSHQPMCQDRSEHLNKQPVEWNDAAAWDVNWQRGMYCIEHSRGCQVVLHSVDDEVNHMDTAHTTDNRKFSHY